MQYYGEWIRRIKRIPAKQPQIVAGYFDSSARSFAFHQTESVRDQVCKVPEEAWPKCSSLIRCDQLLQFFVLGRFGGKCLRVSRMNLARSGNLVHELRYDF